MPNIYWWLTFSLSRSKQCPQLVTFQGGATRCSPEYGYNWSWPILCHRVSTYRPINVCILSTMHKGCTGRILGTKESHKDDYNKSVFESLDQSSSSISDSIYHQLLRTRPNYMTVYFNSCWPQIGVKQERKKETHYHCQKLAAATE